jgi:phosphoglycerate dehydrogenase-like enzyme
MANDRPRVLVCCNTSVRESTIAGEGLPRLEALADWEWLPSEGESSRRPELWGGPSDDPADAARLREKIGDVDALLVCHGAPLIDASVLERAPKLRLVGELEGDRFANRIDVAACAARGVRVVDTTHGSSLPVAEWALGLVLVTLRNAGAHFRRLIADDYYTPWRDHTDAGWQMSELTGRRVGLIGLGHIGRRLVELLRPFRCDVWVSDPYVPKEVALASGVRLTSLDHVLADSEVVVCCAPLTPKTRRMIGARELELLRPGGVFVNVSRGAIVDPDALIARAKRGDVRFGLDVFDPEPIPRESEIRHLPNVFLTPHIASFSRECRPRFFSFMVDELERHFGGHETLYDITPRVLANRHGGEPV